MRVEERTYNAVNILWRAERTRQARRRPRPRPRPVPAADQVEKEDAADWRAVRSVSFRLWIDSRLA